MAFRLGMVVKRSSGYMPGRSLYGEPFEMDLLQFQILQVSPTREFCRFRVLRHVDELSSAFLDLASGDEEVPFIRVKFYSWQRDDQPPQVFFKVNAFAGQVENYRRLVLMTEVEWIEEIDWIFQEAEFRYVKMQAAAEAGFCPLPREYALLG